MHEITNPEEVKRRIAIIEDANISSCWKRSDTIIKSEPHWYQIETPSVNEAWANGVIYSGLDGADSIIKIKQVIDEYQDKGIQFQWIIGPNSKPKDLEQILMDRGLTKAYTCIGMVKNSGTIIDSVDEDITVEIVCDDNVEDYVSTSITGWEQSEGIYFQRKVDMLKFLKNKDQNRYFYLARKKGEPVGTGMTFISDNYGFLKGGAVCPDHRGEGVYKALLSFRLNHLEQLNVPEIYVYALENVTDKLCDSFGFKSVCKIKIMLSN